MPCFGGCEPVFKDLNNAFSAPSTWMVLAGIEDNFLRLPACAKILAPTDAPSIAERLGAISFICVSTCSSKFFRRSCNSRICFARA